MPDDVFHPSFPQFKEVGSIDVDAGSIWIGDGCYVLKDKDEARPKDFGDDWHGICSRFSDRSGYNAYNREFQRWAFGRDRYLFEEAGLQEWMARYADDPEHHRVGTEAYDRKQKVIRAAYDRYEAANPFKTAVVNKGCASFNHDGGHSGMGMMISTFYGDGGYPVYIEYGDNGRPRRVLIDFDPGADEAEEEIDDAESERAA